MKKVLAGVLVGMLLLFGLYLYSTRGTETADEESKTAVPAQMETSPATVEAAAASEDASSDVSALQSNTVNITTEDSNAESETSDAETADSMTEEDIRANMLSDGSYYNESKYYYFTPISDQEVNQFAENVQFDFIEENWLSLSELIQYPITISGSTYYNQNDFLNGAWSSVFDDDWLIGLMDESCYQMELDGNSIRMADGRIRIENVFGSDGTPELVITAINV